MTTKKEKALHLFSELPGFAQTIVVVCIGGFAVLSALYVSQFGWHFSDSRDHWGQFGDFIGGVLNPLVAIGALIGIWYSVALQRKELAETRVALQDQVRLSQITVADQLLQSYFQAINNCAQEISVSRINSERTTIFRADDALTIDTDDFIKWGMWEKSSFDIHHKYANYVETAVNNWLPLMNSIKQTIEYIESTFDESSRKSRFELMQFHLSLVKLLALCFFIRLSNENELHELTRRVNLLKNYPKGEIRDWFYTEIERGRSC